MSAHSWHGEPPTPWPWGCASQAARRQSQYAVQHVSIVQQLCRAAACSLPPAGPRLSASPRPCALSSPPEQATSRFCAFGWRQRPAAPVGAPAAAVAAAAAAAAAGWAPPQSSGSARCGGVAASVSYCRVNILLPPAAAAAQEVHAHTLTRPCNRPGPAPARQPGAAGGGTRRGPPVPALHPGPLVPAAQQVRAGFSRLCWFSYWMQ